MYKLEGSIVLVTGAAGFIASHLCDSLLLQGASVIGVDNFLTGSQENLKEANQNPKFTFIEGDINNEIFLEELFAKHTIQYVFHYAAVLGVKRVLEKPLSLLADIDGFKNLMQQAKKHNIKKVVFASSSEVYGDTRALPLSEDTADVLAWQNHETSIYSIIKLLGEKIMNAYYTLHGVPTCSLRFFNVFGPRQESSAYGFVVGVFIKQVISGKPPTVYGDGYQTRDFIYVKDNVRLAIAALKTKDSDGEVINIGMGRQTTVIDLAERIVRISEKNLKPVKIDGRKQEIRYRTPDVNKMKRILGDEIIDNLDKNLKETYEWYQRQ